MQIELWTAFVVASVALLIIPGPTVLTVISYALSHGQRVKFLLVLAVALGDATALTLSLLGLGSLLATSAFWFQVVKIIGGVYLLYLGFKLIQEGLRATKLQLVQTDSTDFKLFTNTYLVTALNPKGIVFFVAFLPQFVSAEANVASQLWILGATFVALAMLNVFMYAIFASKARDLIASDRTQKLFNLTGGGLLIAAGAWALTAKR